MLQPTPDQLRIFLQERFRIIELRAIIFAIDERDDHIEMTTVPKAAFGIVSSLHKHNRLPKLIEVLQGKEYIDIYNQFMPEIIAQSHKAGIDNEFGTTIAPSKSALRYDTAVNAAPGRESRVIVLHSKAAKDTFRSTVNKLERYREIQELEIELAQANRTKYLTNPDLFNTSLIVIQHASDQDLWRQVINDAKSHDLYVELVLVNAEGSLNTTEVLNSGYYAYFEGTYELSVLNGYIDAMDERINRRKDRYASSYSLNQGANTVKEASATILKQLRTLIDYDRARLCLISPRDYIHDKESTIGKSIRTRLHDVGYIEDEVDWWLLRPLKDDRIITKILSGRIKQRVFPDVKNNLADEGWDIQRSKHVNSWIILPLEYQDEIVGLITLDALNNKRFTYEDMSEITIRLFANQAASTLKSAQKSDINARLQSALKAVAEQTEQTKILDTIAKQACELVDGIYSYVVTPNEKETRLKFVSVYPQEGFKNRLDKEIRHFPIVEFEQQIEKEQGITSLAYVRKQTVLLDDCLGLYKQIGHKRALLDQYVSAEKRAYKPFNHSKDGKRQTSSNIAIPILDPSEEHLSSPASKTKSPKVLGVINVEHADPSAFTTIQIEALEEFARFAAIAIRTQSAKRRLHDLFKASNEATSLAKPSQDLLKSLVNKTETAAHADAGVKIFELIDGKAVLRVYSKSASVTQETSFARQKGHTHKLIKIAQKNQDLIVKRGQYIDVPLVIPDIEKYDPSDYYGIPINKETKKSQTKALLCLPLRLGESVVGAMWLHFTQIQQFTPEELYELQLYANRAAVILKDEASKELLQLYERMNEPDLDKKALAQTIVDYLKQRFNTKGVIFYKNESTRNHLKLYASTYDDNAGKIPHIEPGKKVPYNIGLAGHHFSGKRIDGQNYQNTTIHIPEYQKLPSHHQISEDAQLGKLHSLFSIRLEASRKKNEKVGILILNDETGRTYKESKEELLRFARLSANLLTLAEPQPNTVNNIIKRMQYLARLKK